MLSKTPTEELEVITAHLESATVDLNQVDKILEQLEVYQQKRSSFFTQFQTTLSQAQACLLSLEKRIQTLTHSHTDQG